MNNKIIGDFLLSLRKERSLTQSEIANLCNVSGQAVSKWERGESIPDVEILRKLSLLYNITINELLDGERKSRKENYNNRIFSLKIILLSISLLVFFLPFINDGIILRGFELIYRGLSGYTVYITWLMFITIIFQIIYFSLVSTKIFDKDVYYILSMFISSTLLLALSVTNLAINEFVVFSQFIIAVCAVVLLLMSRWETKELVANKEMKDYHAKLIRKHKLYFDICMIIFSIIFIISFAGLVVNTYVNIEEYLIAAVPAFMVLSYLFTRVIIFSKYMKIIVKFQIGLLGVLPIFVLFVFTIGLNEGYYRLSDIGLLMILVIVTLPILFPIINLKKLNKIATNNR
ncbi:helix-turn-helix transcriptional regulator [Mycoplasmatota bacterium zrk1]